MQNNAAMLAGTEEHFEPRVWNPSNDQRGRQNFRNVAPWYVRHPNLAIFIDIMKGPKRHGNFFQQIAEDLRPLTDCFRGGKDIFIQTKKRGYFAELRYELAPLARLIPWRRDFKKGRENKKTVEEKKTKQPSFWYDELEEVVMAHPGFKALMKEKQQKMNEIRANRKWTVKEVFKEILGISDLDKLDREYDRKYDAFFAEQERKRDEEKRAEKMNALSAAQQSQKVAASSPALKERNISKADRQNNVGNFVGRLVKKSKEVFSAKRAAIMANKKAYQSVEKTMELAPDLSKLGDAETLLAVLNPMIDASRFKTSLTDLEMAEMSLMSRLVNAYGSGNKNLNYLNNLFVTDQFQLQAAKAVAAKLKNCGIAVPEKERLVRKSFASQKDINRWRVALEEKNRRELAASRNNVSEVVCAAMVIGKGIAR